MGRFVWRIVCRGKREWIFKGMCTLSILFFEYIIEIFLDMIFKRNTLPLILPFWDFHKLQIIATHFVSQFMEILKDSCCKFYSNLYNDINIIVFKVVGGTRMSDVNYLLEKAVLETENISNGEKFLLKDLFKGYEWNRISRSDRLLLGTLFLNYINSSEKNIIAIEKTSSGQQQYRMSK